MLGDSVGNLLRVAGFKASCTVNGKTVTLSTGETFTALIAPAASIMPEMLLGGDLREADKLHVLKDWCPASLLGMDAERMVAATVDSTAMKLTNRENDPATPFVTFDIVKV